MKDSEFLRNHANWNSLGATCYYIEKGAHELNLMSRRQHITITEMQAQVQILQKWLGDLHERLSEFANGTTTPNEQPPKST